jgi:alcohol dehydrogenase, propanol-preferring
VRSELPKIMRAMVLEEPRRAPVLRELPVPSPGDRQLLVRVRCCGVCRTDLHVLDGELAQPKLPLVLGHQIVGTVERAGRNVSGFVHGQRVGIPWLGATCGGCGYCQTDRENLCDGARFTGYQLDGGYADFTLVDSRFALPLPASYTDLQVAPLLCAGLIGYRALSMAGPGERIGLYGFGSSAHIIAQVARHQGRRVYAFTRRGDERNQEFARRIGAVWAGGSDQMPPEKLDAAIVFAPAGALVPRALAALAKGGTVVCAGIHMSDIPSFSYDLLWGERSLRSVANLTRRDGLEFLELAPKLPVQTEVTAYPLAELGRALDDLRAGRFSGAAVIALDAD